MQNYVYIETRLAHTNNFPWELFLEGGFPHARTTEWEEHASSNGTDRLHLPYRQFLEKDTILPAYLIGKKKVGIKKSRQKNWSVEKKSAVKKVGKK